MHSVCVRRFLPVDERGEEWALDNYYEKISPLNVLMDVQEKEEFPFNGKEQHDTLIEAETTEMYEAWAAYRENCRSASENPRK